MHYRRVRCVNLTDNTVAGYLGTYNLYTTIVGENADRAWCKWEFRGDQLYLARDTQPQDRWLGEADKTYAGWALKNYNALQVNDDGSLALAGKPKRRLYGPYTFAGTPYCCFSDGSEGDNRSDFLRVELTNPRRWLASVAGSTPICDINLPGTHNSGAIARTRVGDPWSCQDQSLTEQLQSGVRAFDIRLKIIASRPYFTGATTYTFRICHGAVLSGAKQNEYGDLLPALEECKAFLKTYATEFIAIIMKIDDWNDLTPAEKVEAVNALDEQLDAYPIFGRDQPRNTSYRAMMPTLHETRGKIYLLDRVGRPSGSTLDQLAFGPPITIPNNPTWFNLRLDGYRNFVVTGQDRYEGLTAPEEDEKLRLFQNAIQRKTPGTLQLNFASAVKPTPLIGEKLSGVYIQKRIVTYLDRDRPAQLGWCFFDYPQEEGSTASTGTADVVEMVVSSNFNYGQASGLHSSDIIAGLHILNNNDTAREREDL